MTAPDFGALVAASAWVAAVREAMASEPHDAFCATQRVCLPGTCICVDREQRACERIGRGIAAALGAAVNPEDFGGLPDEAAAARAFAEASRVDATPQEGAR